MVRAPAPPSSTGMLAGRRHWAVRAPVSPSSTGMLAWRSCLLAATPDTGKPHRVDRSYTRHSGCCTLVGGGRPIFGGVGVPPIRYCSSSIQVPPLQYFATLG